MRLHREMLINTKYLDEDSMLKYILNPSYSMIYSSKEKVSIVMLSCTHSTSLGCNTSQIQR